MFGLVVCVSYSCCVCVCVLSSYTSATAALPFVPGLSGVKPLLSSPVKDAHGSAPTTRSNDVLRQHFYQCLSAGYQLPTVCYNAVMKRSIIDPLSNLTLYDLPTVAGHDGRKDAPQVSSNITTVGDPDQSSVANEMLLLNMLQIRRKKMKKHKLRKLRKRQRFVMRRRRQLKEKRKERAIQQYEREQASLENSTVQNSMLMNSWR